MSELNRPPVKLLLNPFHLCSLGFGSGYSPKAPGTMGTLVGVLFYLFMQNLPLNVYFAYLLFMFGIGILMCAMTSQALGEHDHGAIVWDEIVGYLITMFAAPEGWMWVVIGFVLFRLFDIWKPWPIGWMDKRIGGGTGIMVDDAVAALYSLIFIQLIAVLLES
jgi:phosphatidylglycerophosphatase A